MSLRDRIATGDPRHGENFAGGDIGCRYTPDTIELVQKALELRAKGILKF